MSTFEFIPSRSRAAELIERGAVTLKGKTLKGSYKVKAGDAIRIEIPEAEPTSLQPLDAPLDVLYQDEDLVVLNKPAGLVVHPSAGHAQDTLVNILLHHIGQLSIGFGENRPGIVHRLDRDTSGILVVAKNDRAHHALAKQFRLKTAHRIYWAIVFGEPRPRERTIRSFLLRHPKDRKRFASNTSGEGKNAVTHIKVLQTVPSGLSWVECRLETGRTHQIRVHLSEAGHPIAGDVVYGAKARLRKVSKHVAEVVGSLGRVALHACELGFEHPRSGKRMDFQVDWPPELRDLARELGFKNV